MTREEAIMVLKNEQPHCGKRALFPEEKKYEAFNVAVKALEHPEQNVMAVVPCGDAISRAAVLEKAINVPIAKVVTEDKVIYRKIVFADDIENLPSVTPKPETVTEFADRCKECGSKYGKTEQFAKWVASEIFDDMWEYNKDAFAEIACRKLEKLGIVRAKGDEWELVEPQAESEE